MKERNNAKTFLIINLAIITILFGSFGYLLFDRIVKLTSDNASQPGEDEEKTYTIRWINDDGTVLETDENVAKGTMPSYDSATPTKAGEGLISYTFKGWNKEITAVISDATYVATYTTNYAQATVTFNMNGVGEALTPVAVDYGGYITKPATPTAAGHTFVAWYKESTCENVWNFATDKVTSNVTLYAKWNVLSYVVSFDPDEEIIGSIPSQTIPYGGKITKPADPVSTDPNAVFQYWFYYNEDYDMLYWDFENDVVTEDIELIGWWIYSF